MLMRPKHSLDRLLTLKARPDGQHRSRVAEEMRGEHWDARRGPVTSFLPLRYRLQSFKVGADILNRNEMMIDILWRARSLTADSFSNQCLERIWAKLFDLFQSRSASEPA
jgi:hypothetical protein